jgi:hypothetical protein
MDGRCFFSPALSIDVQESARLVEALRAVQPAQNDAVLSDGPVQGTPIARVSLSDGAKKEGNRVVRVSVSYDELRALHHKLVV